MFHLRNKKYSTWDFFEVGNIAEVKKKTYGMGLRVKYR